MVYPLRKTQSMALTTYRCACTPCGIHNVDLYRWTKMLAALCKLALSQLMLLDIKSTYIVVSWEALRRRSPETLFWDDLLRRSAETHLRRQLFMQIVRRIVTALIEFIDREHFPQRKADSNHNKSFSSHWSDHKRIFQIQDCFLG